MGTTFKGEWSTSGVSVSAPPDVFMRIFGRGKIVFGGKSVESEIGLVEQFKIFRQDEQDGQDRFLLRRLKSHLNQTVLRTIKQAWQADSKFIKTYRRVAKIAEQRRMKFSAVLGTLRGKNSR